jgi:hypothetical protein
MTGQPVKQRVGGDRIAQHAQHLSHSYELRSETPPEVQAGRLCALRGQSTSPTIRHDWSFSLVLGHSRLLFARYVLHQDLHPYPGAIGAPPPLERIIAAMAHGTVNTQAEIASCAFWFGRVRSLIGEAGAPPTRSS